MSLFCNAVARYSLADLLALLRAEGFTPKIFGEVMHDIFLRGAAVDSREAAPDLLFVARKGARQNGHDYIPAACERGTRSALVSETWAVTQTQYAKNVDVQKDPKTVVNPQHICLIAIPESQGSTEEALFALARAYRRSLKSLFVIAISGSYGKTSTKELLGLMLGSRYRCHTTAGNRNAPVGCALTILGIPAESEVAVLELGIDHPGEMDLLCSLAQPNAALLTGIGWAHLGAFGSRNELARQKARIYAQLQPPCQRCKGSKTKANGIKTRYSFAFLPAADAFLSVLREAVPKNEDGGGQKKEGKNSRAMFCKEVLYSAELAAQQGYQVEDMGLDGLRFSIQSANHLISCTLPLLGLHSQQIFWAAAAVAQELGLETKQIFSSAQQYRPLFGRGELLRRYFQNPQTGQLFSVPLLQDCYNAAPESLYALLATLANWQKQGLLPFCILVLGDMRELGSESVPLHRRALDLLENLLSTKSNKVSSGGENVVALLYGPDFHRAYREHTEKLPAEKREIWQKRCILPQNEDELWRAVAARLQNYVLATDPPLLVLKGARAMRLEKIAEKLLL